VPLPKWILESQRVIDDISLSFLVSGCYVTMDLESRKWSGDENGIAAM
jgi:hypothetical protein